MLWWVKKQILRIRLWAEENLQNEAESLLIWYAVSFAAGAAFYFAFPVELSTWVLVVYLEAVLILLYLAHRDYAKFKFLSYLAIFMLGLCAAKADALYRAKRIEQELPEIMYISGRIVNVDFNSRGRPRLLIADANNYERDLKGEFRISYNGRYDWAKPGTCVELVAKFPQGFSANPLSDYNFERANFYKGISGSGYTVGPLFEVNCPQQNNWFQSKISQIREYIKTVVDNNAKKQSGAIIKALTIGDRSSIDEEQAHNYRTSGLAHFLAISGMHMGIIALLVFLLIRIILCPLGGGRYDLRKPAAVISILFTFGYFLISGQSVSCLRAFVMTSLVLLGVLFNRRAISMRLWAFAVLVVTVITPAAVISPGFLMSFAAVLGLVAFYEKYAAGLSLWLKGQSIIGKISAYIAGILISDMVASLMTLPYTIYYFKQISVYTTLGNLLAGPIIGFWVMPALLLFLLSLPFGLGGYTINLVSSGVDIINRITSWVASLPGAETGEGVGNMPSWGILILTLGLLWLCIWQSRWRIWGVAGIVLGLASIGLGVSADFVFDANGSTYAYRTNENTLAGTRWRKNRFLEKMWTGDNSKGKYEKPSDELLKCSKNECIYQNRIQFSAGKIVFDGKDIPLKTGGYINLKCGCVIYAHPEQGRLWNKK